MIETEVVVDKVEMFCYDAPKELAKKVQTCLGMWTQLANLYGQINFLKLQGMSKWWYEVGVQRSQWIVKKNLYPRAYFFNTRTLIVPSVLNKVIMAQYKQLRIESDSSIIEADSCSDMMSLAEK